jgi:ubiquinone/menaquinone biosynthesis C-methylase UbiE
MKDSFLPLTLDELPDTWVDELKLHRPRDLLLLMQHILGKRHRAIVPESVASAYAYPTYLLAEYHGLPNGYFSKHFTHGYVRSFDKVMLGNMTKMRERVVAALSGYDRVLDIGSGGGEQAALLAGSGIAEVVGIDASPYLVAHANENYPQVQFTVGAAENTGFSDAYFDAVCLGFVFHEIPPKFVDLAIAEIFRILKPGGELIIAEPSSLQLELSARELLRRFGWRGLYFKLLARHMHEPFLAPWQAKDHAQWLAQNGFWLTEEDQSCPVHWWRAQKRDQ